MNKLPSLLAGFYLVFYTAILQAQNPLEKAWDRTFGGLDEDIPTAFTETNDGGYLLAGFSYSGMGGDKTEVLRGAIDFWIVRTDADGNKLWDKTYGGTNGDQLFAILSLEDGSFVLGGISASPVGADKSVPSYGNYDYWILKIDSLGNKIWDNAYGGSASDQLSVMLQTGDGGFLLGGNSASDSSGMKSQPSRGATDFWVVKTDATGNLLWEKSFGGSDADKLYSLIPTDDGGYLLGGSSWSPASGDKSEGNWGLEDFWIVKLDSAGSRQWDKTFGGNESDILYSMVNSPDQGFLLAGRSGSGISGNKTQPLWGGYDFWLIKIDDSGIAQWDRNYGGTGNEDEFGNITLSSDGGYLLAGTSYSSISGDKSESNMGQEQSWIVKLDSLCNKQWDKTIFTPCHDEIGIAMETKGHCYTLVNANGPNCGAGGYRSDASWNNSRDYWIVKFCDTTYYPPVASASGLASLCPGTCASFESQSLRATSWLWNFPGAFPDTSSLENPSGICYHQPGSYDVSLIASNENGNDTLFLPGFITVYPQPPPLSVTQSGDTLFASEGASSYRWYFNSNLIAGATDHFYVASQNGDYNVIYVDSNGCEAEAVIYQVMTHLWSGTGTTAASVFPNPFQDKVILRTATAFTELEVFDLAGRKIMDNAGSIHECELSLLELDAGTYYLKLKSGPSSSAIRIIKR